MSRHRRSPLYRAARRDRRHRLAPSSPSIRSHRALQCCHVRQSRLTIGFLLRECLQGPAIHRLPTSHATYTPAVTSTSGASRASPGGGGGTRGTPYDSRPCQFNSRL